jgi:hypothetical protein
MWCFWDKSRESNSSAAAVTARSMFFIEKGYLYHVYSFTLSTIHLSQRRVTMDVSVAAQSAQGKVVGVIIPPPEIRAVVDKTAQFVAKHGKSFEQKILNSSEGKTAKFNFMKELDPYHAYYEMKIRCVVSRLTPSVLGCPNLRLLLLLLFLPVEISKMQLPLAKIPLPLTLNLLLLLCPSPL